MVETSDSSDVPRVVEQKEQPTAVVAGVVPRAEIRNFFDEAFRELVRCMGEGGFEPVGPPMAVYRGAPTETVEVEVGFPVRGDARPSGAVVSSRLPASRTVSYVHRGNYEDLGESWEQLARWAEDQGLVLGEHLWEVYVTEPRPGDAPADMVTELYWSVSS
jgi:effector-binding domain-containing protein